MLEENQIYMSILVSVLNWTIPNTITVHNYSMRNLTKFRTKTEALSAFVLYIPSATRYNDPKNDPEGLSINEMAGLCARIHNPCA